eukprot:5568277-Amphidinium_carterae.1
MSLRDGIFLGTTLAEQRYNILKLGCLCNFGVVCSLCLAETASFSLEASMVIKLSMMAQRPSLHWTMKKLKVHIRLNSRLRAAMRGVEAGVLRPFRGPKSCVAVPLFASGMCTF